MPDLGQNWEEDRSARAYVCPISAEASKEGLMLYEDPQRFRFAGGMEGVPEPAAAPSTGQRWLDAAARVLPGVALAALLAFAAVSASEWIGVAWLGFAQSPVPPALLA